MRSRFCAISSACSSAPCSAPEPPSRAWPAAWSARTRTGADIVSVISLHHFEDVGGQRAGELAYGVIPGLEKQLAEIEATLDDTVIAFTDQGSGPVIVLLHGHAYDHSMWNAQIPALVEAGWRVIAPDLRGFGDSAVTEGMFSAFCTAPVSR